MSDQWMIEGREFANCNCAHGCPCQFNSPATHGYCEAIASVIIDEGYFNDVRLDGLKFCGLYQWPGQIADGKGQSQIIIDEKADARQRAAIDAIAHGKSTTPGSTVFFVFDSTVIKRHETLYTPIEMSIDLKARKAHTHIAGLVESSGEPLKNPFTGGEDRKAIYLPGGFEYMFAEIGNGNSHATAGVKMGLKNSYGQFAVLKMNQDGVIRDQKIPL